MERPAVLLGTFWATPSQELGSVVGDTLSNGELLAEAERAGFKVFLTADKNIRYQQNLTGLTIAIVVLSTPQWPLVRLHAESIAAVINAAAPGSYIEVQIPDSPDQGPE